MFLNFIIIKIKIGDLEMRRESFRGGGIDLKSCFFLLLFQGQKIILYYVLNRNLFYISNLRKRGCLEKKIKTFMCMFKSHITKSRVQNNND
jgi:hypothetical protein